MPIIKSAIKRMRQTEVRRARNVTTKRGLRAALKAFMTSKTTDDLRQAQSEIDTAVKKNLMSKNTAARRKAQLSRLAKEAGAKPVAGKKAVVTKTEAKAPAPAKKTAAAKPAAAKKTTAKKPTTKKAV